MAVLGLNLGSTEWGRPLKDGGACLLSGDGLPAVAIAEERLSRVKHQGGFTHSVNYCLDAAAIGESDVDLCVATSCCEPFRSIDSIPELKDAPFAVKVAGHHEAHAYSAFWPSPFDEALVVVLDAGGNVLHSDGSLRWWSQHREQATYYVGRGNELEVIGRDFDRPFDAGFGEVFRAFTHYLGWPSSTFAGNTMALSAFGDGKLRGRSIWEARSDRLEALVNMGDPSRPISLVSDLIAVAGQREIPCRRPGVAFSQEHANLAEWVQSSFYEALRFRIESLVTRTGIRRACFAGGVALNCVAMGQLLRDGVLDEIFVQPAAGDTGQCLGAACQAYRSVGGERHNFDTRFSPFLGKRYSSSEIDYALDFIQRNCGSCTFVEPSRDVLRQVARLLASGRIVAWFSGRSEFGPRALGSRSILADPRDRDVKERALAIKGREKFLPFAPSVLEGYEERYFDHYGSYYMTVAVPVREGIPARIPGVVHADGSARVQVVSDELSKEFTQVLRYFGDITGEFLILNTSLNLRGEPIAETPLDAADIFVRSKVDCLYLDGALVIKS